MTAIIYLISILSKVGALSALALVISGIVALILFTGFLFAVIEPDSALVLTTEERRKMALHGAKTATIIFIISLVVCIFIPSEEHMVAMLLSSYATTDNLNMVVEQLKGAVLFLKENGVF